VNVDVEWEKLQSDITNGCGQDSIRVTYVDDEDEKITIDNQNDWEEAVMFATTENSGVFKLYVEHVIVKGAGQKAEAVEQNEPKLPPLNEILMSLMSLAQEDEAIRSELPDVSRIVVSDRLAGKSIKETCGNILENCEAIRSNEYIKSLGLPDNLDEIFGSMANPPHIGVFNPFGRNENLKGLFGCFKDAGFGFNEQATVEKVLNARFVEDGSHPDGDVVYSDEASILFKTWIVENNGELEWEEGTKVVYDSGSEELVLEETFDVPKIAVGDTGEVSAVLRVPSEPGHYKTQFRLRDPVGNKYGDALWIDVEVQ